MTVGGICFRLYRHSYRALPVTLHLAHDWRFNWRGIYGFQIGPWFIGAIKGSVAPIDAQHTAETGR